MATFDTFRGVAGGDIGKKTPSEILTDSLITYVDWGFLQAGAYFNVQIPTSGAYGGDFSSLRPVKDPRYTDGQVWESAHQNWIWESGLQTPNAPISISGVFIDGDFSLAGSGHYYDYPLGRVVFDTPIATSSEVKVEYSYKWINVNDGDAITWLSRPNYKWSRVDSPFYSQAGSGDFSDLGDRTINLPSVSVQVPPISKTSGYELGSDSRYANNNISFHILTDNKGICQKLADILADHNQKTVFLFDSNKMVQSGVYPLDYRGMVREQALTYPQLVDADAYRWNKIKFENAAAENIQRLSDSLYYCVVNASTSMVLFNN